MPFQRLQKRQKFLFPAALVIGVITSLVVGFLVVKAQEEEALADYRAASLLYISDMVARFESRARAPSDMVNFYDQAPEVALANYQKLFSSQSVFKHPDVMVHVLIEQASNNTVWADHQRLYDIDFSLLSPSREDLDSDGTAKKLPNYRVGAAWPLKDNAAPPADIKALWDNVSYAAVRRVTNHAHASEATKMVFTDVQGRTQRPDSTHMLAHTVTPMTLVTGERVALVQSVPLASILPNVQQGDTALLEAVSLEPLSENTVTRRDLQAIAFGIDGSAKNFDGDWTGVQTVSMLDQEWAVKTLAGQGQLSFAAWPAITIVTLGIAVTIVMSLGIWTEVRHTARVSDIVARRTAALKDAEQEQMRQNQQLRELNEELTSATEEAETANLAKSEFLATMSHELRTPLNAILGFSQILREETLGPIGDDRYVEYADDINQSGEHLLRLINDILDLAKLEAGRIAIDVSPVALGASIEHVVALHHRQAEDKGLSLTYEIAQEMPDVIMGDELRLRQILINLLTNAIKFTDEGSVALRVFPNAFPIGSPGWVIEVADTGIGIEEDRKAILFERFAQADTTLSRKHGGVGLGLAICKELVRKMEGLISFDSELEKGTTFRVQLPLDEVKADYDDGDFI